ncbi:MAG: fructosamine kinase family protein [Anaerolineales bacterium]|jgi:fructosamine-3-kinase|nr:fructosamine kinase family protein [Anaerolineales bacterium]
MVPAAVKNWIELNGYGAVVAAKTVGGGCINNGAKITTTSGDVLFLKTNSRAPTDMFAREAEGLIELADANDSGISTSPRVPDVLTFGQNYILLEYIHSSARNSDYWQKFGHELASMHKITNPRFGFQHDNYIGSTPQLNPWTIDGYEFFAEQRLLFQVRLAQDRRYLDQSQVKRTAALCRRLPELIPEQPASRIHGDLWGGNAMADENGSPVLIDPAVNYCWAEAELAMTALFGTFPETFYQAYQEVRPLAPGYRERFPLYNLYHVLNHINLFGRSYVSQAISILSRYS